jgi:oligoribonuclease
MSKKIDLSDKILWIDLEMTGLDSDKDKILEVGAIITDWKLNEVASFSSPVKVNNLYMKKRMKISKDFWHKFPEVHKQLVEQNKKAVKSNYVEKMLLEFIKPYINKNQKMILAGNSIHQDRKFIDKQWKTLSSNLHYRMLDVSSWKVVFENRFKKQFLKPEEHRAVDDIRGSILELQYYYKYIK